jgi:hypothetical protein
MTNKILTVYSKKFNIYYFFYAPIFLLAALSPFMFLHKGRIAADNSGITSEHTVVQKDSIQQILPTDGNLEKINYSNKKTPHTSITIKLNKNKSNMIEKIISPYKKVFVKKVDYIKNKKDILKILSSNKLVKPILAISDKTKVPARLIAAMIHVESSGNSRAISSAGAMGLMQISENIARHYNVNPYIPYQNIEAGTKYIKHLIIKFHSLRLALAAYNAGPSFVINNGCVGGPEIYATKVMYYYYYS